MRSSSVAASAGWSFQQRLTNSFCGAPTRCCPSTCRPRCETRVSVSLTDVQCAHSLAVVRCVQTIQIVCCPLSPLQTVCYESVLNSKTTKKAINGGKDLRVLNTIMGAFA